MTISLVKFIILSVFLLIQNCPAFGQDEVLSKIRFPFIPGKELDTLNNGNLPSYSHSYVLTTHYDTLNNILYSGGWFKNIENSSRSCIAAFDVNSGKLLPWSVQITGGLEHVYSINRYGDTVFIAGDFNKVNGIVCPFLAAVNANTGQLLYWRPHPDSSLKSIYIDKQKLYVGGHFHEIGMVKQPYLAIFDLKNLILSSWQPPKIADSLQGCNHIKIYQNKIYFMSQPGSFNSIWFGANVQSLDIGAVSLNPSLTKNSEVFDFNVLDNSLFWTSSGNKLGFAVDIFTKQILPWDPKLYFENKINSVIWTILTPYKKSFYGGTKSIVGLTDESSPSALKRYSINGIGEEEKTLKTYPGINIPNPKLNTILFDLFTVGNDNLIVFERIYRYKRYIGDSIQVYCLAAPSKPSAFQTSTAAICKGQKQAVYSVSANKKYAYYKWSYSGTGATINGTGNSITIDFAENATAGVLSVTGYNSCDMASPPLELNISIAPGPTVQLSSTGNISCKQTQVQLNSTTTTAVNYSWTGPNNFSSTQPNVQVSQAGTYQLKITSTATGCSSAESITIKADTATPKPVVSANTYILTCNQPAILVKGSTQNSNDSLRWITPTGVLFGSSITVTAAGQYTLHSISKSNGCQARITFTVTSNTTPPQLSIPTITDTITCKKTSITVALSSGTSNTTLSWQSPAGTVYNNPATLTTGGVYAVYAVNNTNGCVTKSTVTVPEDRALPLLNLPTHNLKLSCSNPYTFVKAVSTHDSIDIDWNDPSDSIKANPIYVTKPGTYKVTATNPYNGCISNDQLIATYSNELTISAGNSVNLCPGNGTATLQASVTDPYHFAGALTYNWQPSGITEATATVKPTTTTTYTLSVKSSKGCEGTSYVTVNVYAPMQDSLSISQPCFNNDGKVKVKIKNNGYPPYQYWATDSAGTIVKPLQDSATFVKLKGFTNYYFYTKDSKGCIKQSEQVDLGATLKEPVIDFLVSSYLMSKDTFVLVNISDPLPDSVTWHIDKATILYSDNQKAIAVRTDTGLVAAGLEVNYGRCRSINYKNIRITPFDSTMQIPEQLKGISYLNLNPNPNTGKFTITIKLGVKQNFTVFIYDALGINYYQEKVQSSDSYQNDLDLNLLSGTYILKVIAMYDVRQRAFLVSK